jgi:hypothetical protein
LARSGRSIVTSATWAGSARRSIRAGMVAGYAGLMGVAARLCLATREELRASWELGRARALWMSPLACGSLRGRSFGCAWLLRRARALWTSPLACGSLRGRSFGWAWLLGSVRGELRAGLVAEIGAEARVLFSMFAASGVACPQEAGRFVQPGARTAAAHSARRVHRPERHARRHAPKPRTSTRCKAANPPRSARFRRTRHPARASIILD